MSDTHSKEVRSYNMSRIRSGNTRPELLVRQYLHSKGFRYRLHNKNLPGRPDLVLKKYNSVIFVHGCFWHSHENCKYSNLPKSNRSYWESKLKRNKERDKITNNKLKALGWRVLTVWECELRRDKREPTLRQLKENILRGRI